MEQVRKLECLERESSRLEGVRDRGSPKSLWDPTGIIQFEGNAAGGVSGFSWNSKKFGVSSALAKFKSSDSSLIPRLDTLEVSRHLAIGYVLD